MSRDDSPRARAQRLERRPFLHMAHTGEPGEVMQGLGSELLPGPKIRLWV